MSISRKFIKPNSNDRYQAHQSDIVFGLWTPYGVISPMTVGIAPDGSILIVYAIQPGASFRDIQKKKLEYIESRGVKLDVMPLDMQGRE